MSVKLVLLAGRSRTTDALGRAFWGPNLRRKLSDDGHYCRDSRSKPLAFAGKRTF